MAKCETCRHEHLMSFSCTYRGFCPSGAAKRIAEAAGRQAERAGAAVGGAGGFLVGLSTIAGSTIATGSIEGGAMGVPIKDGETGQRF